MISVCETLRRLRFWDKRSDHAQPEHSSNVQPHDNGARELSLSHCFRLAVILQLHYENRHQGLMDIGVSSGASCWVEVL